MGHRARSSVAIITILAIGLVSAFVAVAGASTKGKKDSGTSYVSIVHSKGKTLYAAGYSFDKRFGQTAVTYVTGVTPGTSGTVNVTVKKVTEYLRTGTLVGTASAVQNLATGEVTNGKLNLNHGTGKLKGHTFKGTFSGTFDPTTRVYTFKYKGTYK